MTAYDSILLGDTSEYTLNLVLKDLMRKNILSFDNPIVKEEMVKQLCHKLYTDEKFILKIQDITETEKKMYQSFFMDYHSEYLFEEDIVKIMYLIVHKIINIVTDSCIIIKFEVSDFKSNYFRPILDKVTAHLLSITYNADDDTKKQMAKSLSRERIDKILDELL